MKKLSGTALLSILSVILIGIIFTGFTYQETVKIGYIDSEKIFNEYEEFLEAEKRIEEERERYDTEFKEMQDEFVTRREEYDSQKILMSEERQNEMKQELDRLYQEINAYGQRHFGQDGTIAQLNAELTEPILEKLRMVIASIGDDLDYDYILDGTAEAVLFSRSVHDMTDLVLEELDK